MLQVAIRLPGDCDEGHGRLGDQRACRCGRRARTLEYITHSFIPEFHTIPTAFRTNLSLLLFHFDILNKHFSEFICELIL